MTDRTPLHPEHIRQAAQWLADRKSTAADTFAPVLPTVKARFSLTDADAAEATLLAGNYSVYRRAFA